MERRRQLLESLLRPRQLRDQFLLQHLAPVLVLKERFQKSQVVHMASQNGCVALIDVGEILDLLRIELGQHFGNAEAVDTGVLKHARSSEEAVFQYRGATRTAVLPGSGSALPAPEAADIAAHGLAAMNAQVAGFPIDRLRARARLADGAHGLVRRLPADRGSVRRAEPRA